MTRQRSVRIVMISHQEDDDPEGSSLTATVLFGLLRTYEMEKRSEFPRRFNLTPR
jgi:hypothetical protein